MKNLTVFCDFFGKRYSMFNIYKGLERFVSTNF